MIKQLFNSVLVNKSFASAFGIGISSFASENSQNVASLIETWEEVEPNVLGNNKYA